MRRRLLRAFIHGVGIRDANQTQAGNGAKNLGTVRRIVLNMLNQDGSTIKSLPKKRRQALLNYSYRESTLSLT